MAKRRPGATQAQDNDQTEDAENYFDTDQQEIDKLKLGIFAEGEKVVVQIDNCSIQPTKANDKLGLLCFLQGDDNYRTIVHWTDDSFMSSKFSKGRSLSDMVNGKENLIDLLWAASSEMTLGEALKAGSQALLEELQGKLLKVECKVGEYEGSETNSVKGMEQVTASDDIPDNLDTTDLPF